MISDSLIAQKLWKQPKILTFCSFYSKFYANHEKIYAGAARHARDISELWMAEVAKMTVTTEMIKIAEITKITKIAKIIEWDVWYVSISSFRGELNDGSRSKLDRS